MMNVEVFCAGLAGAIAALALALVAYRFGGRAGQRAISGLIDTWRRTSVTQAGASLTLLVAVAGLALAYRSGANGSARSSLPVVSHAKLEASALAAFADAPGNNTDRAADSEGREKALNSLRQFADKVRDKRQSIAAIGDDQANAGDEADTKAALPDVDTMIVRLEKRLESEPGNVSGWQMLGWSYANTGKYKEAISAYRHALELAPGNAAVIAALEDTKKRAADPAQPMATPDNQMPPDHPQKSAP